MYMALCKYHMTGAGDSNWYRSGIEVGFKNFSFHFLNLKLKCPDFSFLGFSRIVFK